MPILHDAPDDGTWLDKTFHELLYSWYSSFQLHIYGLVQDYSNCSALQSCNKPLLCTPFSTIWKLECVDIGNEFQIPIYCFSR